MWDFADVYKKDQFAFSYLTLHEWVYKKRKGKKIKEYLDRNGIHRIALYGFGSLADVIMPELIEEKIDIAYIVDKNPKQCGNSANNIKIVLPEDVPTQPPVDAFVVCHVYYYNTIAGKLESFGIAPESILSLNDIVFSL